MKVMITIFGLMTVLAGVLPFAGNFNILPAYIPTTGMWYYGIIIGIGVLGFIYGVTNPGMLLYGTDRFIPVFLGILTLFGGVLPFVQNFGFLKMVPATGLIYSGIISLIGIIGIIYGATQI